MNQDGSHILRTWRIFPACFGEHTAAFWTSHSKGKATLLLCFPALCRFHIGSATTQSFYRRGIVLLATQSKPSATLQSIGIELNQGTTSHPYEVSEAKQPIQTW